MSRLFAHFTNRRPIGCSNRLPEEKPKVGAGAVTVFSAIPRMTVAPGRWFASVATAACENAK
jgi:hypothetical protein